LNSTLSVKEMSCYSCFVSRKKDVSRIEVDNSSRSAHTSGSSSNFFTQIFIFLNYYYYYWQCCFDFTGNGGTNATGTD